MKTHMMAVCLGLASLAGVLSLESSAQAQTNQIIIRKVDTRDIKNLNISISYTINGTPYVDWETLTSATQSWNQNVYVVLRQATATWDGSEYVGDFVHEVSTGSCSSNCYIQIDKTDTRAISNVVVSLGFSVDGAPHWDYEATTFNLSYPGSLSSQWLDLDANDPVYHPTTWDGTQWVGNMLYIQTEPPH